jgi:methyltransferase (TIGR00027 family)
VAIFSRQPERTASRTAEINAAMRAAEDHQPPDRRVFHDPFAHYFVQHPTYRMVSAPPLARMGLEIFDRVYGGLHAEQVLRNRYYETQLSHAHSSGVTQLVLLGAGYDSTAFRERLEGVTIFEVDAPATQRVKRRIIERHDGLKPLAHVVYVECDFEHDDLGGALDAAGFDRERPCLAVWLGVSYYLTEATVRDTLANVASLSAPASQLIWDYLDRAVVDGVTPYGGARRAAAAVAKRGEPYIFGLEAAELGSICAETGFEVEDHARVPDLADHLGPPGGVWCNTDDFMGVVRARRRAE